jgi:SAM-dependent methyltransferase
VRSPRASNTHCSTEDGGTIHGASIENWRSTLIALAPKLEEMAVKLAKNNADYDDVVETPLLLLNHLSGGSLAFVEEACRGYISFCETFYEKQIEFGRSAHYAASSYERVNAEVYQNAQYMAQVYYPALLLSYLFSSNYFHLYRTFRDRFVPAVRNLRGYACEIGIGHGLLSATLLSSAPALFGHGLDISPVAAQVTDRVSAFFGLRSPIVTELGDARHRIPLAGGSRYPVMICAEVLEHLPDPALLLRRIHEALSDGGLLFLTASINMESVDHLYLFRSDDEVVAMVEDCRLNVVERDLAFLTVAHYRDRPETCMQLISRGNPATAVLIATKAPY